MLFLYVLQQFWQSRVKLHYKRKGVHRTPGFLYCFGRFEFWGWIPCALLFVVVVVVIVVVVVVVFERGSGPVSGFGCTRSFSGVHLGCFYMCFSSSGNLV